MADDTTTGGDLQSDLAHLKPSGGGPLNTKRLFLIGLIAVGLFMFYVIFLKQKAAPSTTTPAPTSGTPVSTSDPSAIGSLQTGIESLQQQLTSQGTQLGTIGANAAGARTDASITLNGVNDLLHNGSGPKPTPVPTPKPPVLVTGTLMTAGGIPTVTHLQQSGLAHQ